MDKFYLSLMTFPYSVLYPMAPVWLSLCLSVYSYISDYPGPMRKKPGPKKKVVQFFSYPPRKIMNLHSKTQKKISDNNKSRPVKDPSGIYIYMVILSGNVAVFE